jgi:hypothetical protein
MKLKQIALNERVATIPSGNRVSEIGSVLVGLLEKNRFGAAVKAGNQRGKGYAIRADFGPDEKTSYFFNSLKDWKNQSVKFDVTPLSPSAVGSLSGTYTTFILVPRSNVLVSKKFMNEKSSRGLEQAKKNVDGEVIWKAGEGLPVVNATAGKGKKGGQKHFKTKDLVPEKFGLAGQKISTAQYPARVKNAIESLLSDKKPQAIALKHIIDRVDIDNGTVISLDKEILGAIEADVNVVAKDFGEVAGALWYAQEEGAEEIFFPAASNEALVDYAIIKKGVTYRVSAKAGRGGPPSVKVIPGILEDLQKTGFMGTLSAKEQKAADLLREISHLKVVESIIHVNRELNTVAWKELNKMIRGGVSNAEDIETWITTQDEEVVLKKLAAFYSKIGNSAGAEKVLKGNGEKKGIVLAPMGQHAKGVLNSLPEFDSVLNKALQSVTVIQVFLDMKLGAMKFTVRPFAEGDFQFDYNGVASLPSNRGFSFRMKKGNSPGVANLPESFLKFFRG